MKGCWGLFILLCICLFHSCVARKKGRRTLNVDGNCPSDPELEHLVKQKGTRTIMYIMTFNNASDFIASRYMECRSDWVKIARIPMNEYYESSIFQDFMRDHRKEWSQYDYVVTATYKSLTPLLLPTSVPAQTFSDLKQMLKLAQNNLFDVYPFLRSETALLNASVALHGDDFTAAWEGILRELYVDDETIAACNHMHPFYRNVFMIKTPYLDKLVNAMQKAFQAAQSPMVSSLLAKDAHFRSGSSSIAQRVFGTPYYQFHPFVFQLLPPCFLQILQARMCMAPVGVCAFNYEYQG